MVRIGTSGWVYSSWRRTFYPQGLAQSGWLAHYAKNFDTVEVNATFYRLARRTSPKRGRTRCRTTSASWSRAAGT